MSRRITRKWRPPLTLVMGGTLFAVFALPFVGLTWLRLAGNVLGWWETALLIGGLALAVATVLAWLLWRLVLRPVWALTAHAHAVRTATGALEAPTRFGTAELSDLGHSVIEMGDALQARARSLVGYADHVTHELKSPLTALQGATDLLKDPDLAHADRSALLDTIDASAARMETLLNALRAHATARIEAAPGNCLLSEAVDSLDAGIECVVLQDGRLPMSVADLGRVLVQLSRNAKENGATRMTATWFDCGVRVSDDGAGVAQGDRGRIFDPFFTTRRDSGGTGMGLSIVRTLIEAAGGTIRLGKSKTTCFVLTF